MLTQLLIILSTLWKTLNFNSTYAQLPWLCVAGRFDCSAGFRSVWYPTATRWRWGNHRTSTQPGTCTPTQERPLSPHRHPHWSHVRASVDRQASPERSRPVFPHLLSSPSCKRQARRVHSGQNIVSSHTWSLAHQTAHVGGEGLRAVDQLMDLCWLQTGHSSEQGVQHWLWGEREMCMLWQTREEAELYIIKNSASSA